MQLDRQISEASAEKYLSGNFRVLDTTQMADNANLIFARNDLWQAFKFSAQGNALATHYERCNMMGIPGPPLPPGMPFVSREEFNHGRDMATRAMEQDKSVRRSDKVCAIILREFNDCLHSTVHTQLVPIHERVEHNFAKIITMRQYVEQTMI